MTLEEALVAVWRQVMAEQADEPVAKPSVILRANPVVHGCALPLVAVSYRRHHTRLGRFWLPAGSALAAWP